MVTTRPLSDNNVSKKGPTSGKVWKATCHVRSLCAHVCSPANYIAFIYIMSFNETDFRYFIVSKLYLKLLTIHYNQIQYNTIQYNTIQYNTIQYNTIQYNTMQCNAMQCNTIQYNTMQCNAM